MRNKVNFNHLECFFSLAKTLSFSQTSKDLGIAQPAVSKQIKSLEEQFDTQLFLRTKREVRLTKDGEKLYSKIFPLYNEINQRIDDYLDNSEALKGKITFGCLSEIGEKIFIKPLAKFKSLHPKLKVEVIFLKGHEIIDGIKEGTIDIGIIADKIVQENIRAYEILSEEIMLVTRGKNKISKITDITEHPFVSYRHHDPLLDYYVQKVFPKTKKSTIQKEFMVNSHKSMVDVLLDSNYLAVLPSLSIQDEIKKGTLKNIGPKVLKSGLFMIYPDLEFKNNNIEALSAYLRKFLKQ